MTVDLESIEARAKRVSEADGAIGEITQCLAFDVPALIAEVRRLREMTSVTMGVGRGDGRLLVHGDYESILAAQAFILAVERVRALPEKWRKDLANFSTGRATRVNPYALIERATAAFCEELEAALRGKEGGQ